MISIERLGTRRSRLGCSGTSQGIWWSYLKHFYIRLSEASKLFLASNDYGDSYKAVTDAREWKVDVRRIRKLKRMAILLQIWQKWTEEENDVEDKESDVNGSEEVEAKESNLNGSEVVKKKKPS